MARIFVITHPDVVVSAEVPVPRWPLSQRGLARMRAGLRQPWLEGVRSVFCSTEQKAIDGADILARALGLTPTQRADLGENDRSATGFLAQAEFEATADEFFAHPDRSVRGWETALAAQDRIRRATCDILDGHADGDIAIVSHGAVGTLLLCHLSDTPIARASDQPKDAVGGFYYSFDAVSRVLDHGWARFDVLAGEDRLDAERRRYAEELAVRSDLQNREIVDAFAVVPREAFFGDGPWRVLGEAGYETTPSADPAVLYENQMIAIDESRLLNNGEPAALAAWFECLGIRRGERVLHVGAGVGYYTAILAAAVGPDGRVTGVELDHGLAARAKKNTAAWSNVTIESHDGTALALEAASLDAIFVNAGATHPPSAWLDALRLGGRLMLPLTVSAHPTGIGLGHMLLVENRGSTYPAKFVSPVGIYPCLGARTEAGDAALRAALEKGGFEGVRELRRDSHDHDERCWLHGDGFCVRLASDTTTWSG